MVLIRHMLKANARSFCTFFMPDQLCIVHAPCHIGIRDTHTRRYHNHAWHMAPSRPPRRTGQRCSKTLRYIIARKTGFISKRGLIHLDGSQRNLDKATKTVNQKFGNAANLKRGSYLIADTTINRFIYECTSSLISSL